MTMTLEEAQAELNELRGLAQNKQDLSFLKERISDLYWQVCHKTLRKCNCKNVLQDALFEIYAKLKNKDTMANINSNARLVNGVVLQWENKHYTNANLTDEVAQAFLAKFPQRKDWFAILPETPKKSEEIAPKEVESESKSVAAPKKKKPSKKRK